MSITITATVGSASANSFVTEAEAIAYVVTRLNAPSGWTTFAGSTCTESEKKALIEAQREINAMEFVGNKASADQALQWPRDVAPDPDSPTGWYYSSVVIPQRVKDAQMEYAWQFIKAGTTDIASADSEQGVILKTIGPITTQWESSHSRPTGLSRFPRVMALLRPLLAGSGASLRIVRG